MMGNIFGVSLLSGQCPLKMGLKVVLSFLQHIFKVLGQYGAPGIPLVTHASFSPRQAPYWLSFLVLQTRSRVMCVKKSTRSFLLFLSIVHVNRLNENFREIPLLFPVALGGRGKLTNDQVDLSLLLCCYAENHR